MVKWCPTSALRSMPRVTTLRRASAGVQRDAVGGEVVEALLLDQRQILPAPLRMRERPDSRRVPVALQSATGVDREPLVPVAGRLARGCGEEADDDARSFRPPVRPGAVRQVEVERSDEVALDDLRVQRDAGVALVQRSRRDAEEHHRAAAAVGRFDDRDPVTRPGERGRIGNTDEAEVQRRQTLAQAGDGTHDPTAPGTCPPAVRGSAPCTPPDRRPERGAGRARCRLDWTCGHATVWLDLPVEPAACE